MPKGRVIRVKWITRAMLQEYKEVFFVFGDNLERVGLGGQAREMRGEPNAIGVPTKRAPGLNKHDFFYDGDWVWMGGGGTENLQPVSKVACTIATDFYLVELLLNAGNDVVIPTDGIGTGLSELPTRAPTINAWIEARIKELEDKYPNEPELVL